MQAPRLTHPLPQPTPSPDTAAQRAASRRCHAGQVCLDGERLLEFKARIERCVGSSCMLDADSLACIARQLLALREKSSSPACITERMRCAAAMELMLRDRDWQPDAPVARIITDVVDYLRSSATQLIPNSEPVVGRLDDAILVDHAWPLAEHEVLVYCDYRRLRLLEAELHGIRPAQMHFHRDDYEQARAAERELYARERQTGLGSYVARPAAPSNGLLIF